MPSMFLVSNRIESAYRRSISNLLMRELPRLKGYQEIDTWVKNLAELSQNNEFISDSRRISSTMVRDVDIMNVFSWRETSRKSSGGSRASRYLHETKKGSIRAAFDTQIELSTEYISSVPYKIAYQLAKDIDSAREQGATEQGVYNIVNRRYSSLLSMKINLISRTDPHRASTAFTEARSEDLGLNCFIWNTKDDSSVRFSHRKMNEVVVFWRELPSPEALIGQPANLGYYAAGDCPNCRCFPFPIFSVEDLFASQYKRIKVYIDGSIRFLTRSQFIKIL